ncbi:MAG TPA: vitamin K epoxide reductase family protein [Actinomycetes bacterium]|nr:vitamin K epoxide reductase family protein [Actinomycetes bacterium]
MTDLMPLPRAWFGVAALAAVVGMASTVIQIVERITLAENADANLLCDINGTFSCGNVLTAWQSSVFGPIPNSAIGLSVFAFILGIAGAGGLGSQLSKAAWGVATFFAGFMAVFTVWFLAQTAFVISAVCLYCLVIGSMVLLINISWWRIGNRLGYLEGNRFLGAAGWLVRGGTDLFLWIGLGVIVAVMMVAGLAI